MVIGAKFWHGNMSAKLVFSLANEYAQYNDSSQGICTAASLAWCRACLRRGGPVNTFEEIGVSFHNLNISMATIRRLDNDPVKQTETAGLVPVGPDHNGLSIDEVMRIIGTTAPFIGIFWTAGHTMAYRYNHHDKELFDVEQGLFRSKYTAGIRAKFLESYAGVGLGCRVVNLD